MRPTVTEQLEGVCRILDEVIAPELGESHTRETLRSLIANVRMLARNWQRVLPFLLWDNAATTALLVSLRAEVNAALRARIDAVLAVAPIDAGDGDAVEVHNDALREALAACIVSRCAPAASAQIKAHLAARARRYPLRVTGAQPKSRDGTKESS